MMNREELMNMEIREEDALKTTELVEFMEMCKDTDSLYEVLVSVYNLGYMRGSKTPVRGDLEDLAGTLVSLIRRELTSTESQMVDRWSSFGADTKMLKEAYEMTMEHSGKYSVGYMDAVMKKLIEG